MNMNFTLTIICAVLSIAAAIISFVSFKNKRHADRAFAQLIKDELEPKKDVYQKKSSYGRDQTIKEIVNESENDYKGIAIGLGVLTISTLTGKIQNSKDREIIEKTLDGLSTDQRINYLNEIIAMSALTGTYHIIKRGNEELGLIPDSKKEQKL